MKDISDHYRRMGVDAFYSIHADDYSNPHGQDVEACLKALWDDRWDSLKVLDLACGDGLVSKWIANNHPHCTVHGADKFMDIRYTVETGNRCFPLSFEDIALHNHNLDSYQLIIISYAFDLVKPSFVNILLWELSTITDQLLIIRPNNKVIVSPLFEIESAVTCNKAKAKLYFKRDTSEDYIGEEHEYR